MTEENYSNNLTVKLTQDLIKINTSNYGLGNSEGEEKAAEYVTNYLSKYSIPFETVESLPGRVSVIARLKGKNSDLDPLVVHGHLDVVPADAKQWRHDPFSGKIEDGCIWGRGAVDMKNMVAMILASIAYLQENGGPNRDLILAFFADEENGGVYGAHHVVSTRPELFAGAKNAISEVGGYSIIVKNKRLYLLQTGEKALLWLTLKAKSPSAHGSRVIKDNSVVKIAEAVMSIAKHEWPVHITDASEILLNKLADLVKNPAEDIKKLSPEEIFYRAGNSTSFIQASIKTTSNPTGLLAGGKHNVIPPEAKALVDVRTIPGDEDKVLEQIINLVGNEIEVEVTHRDIGPVSKVNSHIAEALTNVIQKHDPEADIIPYLMPGGTDNKALSRLGIEGYGFVPLRLPEDFDFTSMFHGVDERIPIDSLLFGQEVLNDFLLNY